MSFSSLALDIEVDHRIIKKLHVKNLQRSNCLSNMIMRCANNVGNYDLKLELFYL